MDNTTRIIERITENIKIAGFTQAEPLTRKQLEIIKEEIGKSMKSFKMEIFIGRQDLERYREHPGMDPYRHHEEAARREINEGLKNCGHYFRSKDWGVNGEKITIELTGVK